MKLMTPGAMMNEDSEGLSLDPSIRLRTGDGDVEVVALVGASGTGKSQRAVVIANMLGTQYMIDDGLLIRGDKILAGRSAKAEPTKVAAVRRAIFSDPRHASEVQDILARERPERLLVLATSKRMARRICEMLALSPPARYLLIEDLASEEEIRAAIRSRQGLGQHVIPVPTMEVTRTLTGFFINPLRLLYRGGMFRQPVVFEKTLVRPTFSTLGHFYISDRVVTSIARYAVREIPRIALRIPPVTRVEDGSVALAITCELEGHHDLIDSLVKVQNRVKHAVEHMTGLTVTAVNINVVSIQGQQKNEGWSK